MCSTLLSSTIEKPARRMRVRPERFPSLPDVFAISVSANLREGDAVDGIADMGGTEGWGPTHPPRVDEPVFGEAWEGRAFALALLSTRLAGWNLDAFRHALERLSRAAYLDDGYFGRWLNVAELVLTDSAVSGTRGGRSSRPQPAWTACCGATAVSTGQAGLRADRRGLPT